MLTPTDDVLTEVAIFKKFCSKQPIFNSSHSNLQKGGNALDTVVLELLSNEIAVNESDIRQMCFGFCKERKIPHELASVVWWQCYIQAHTFLYVALYPASTIQATFDTNSQKAL